MSCKTNFNTKIIKLHDTKFYCCEANGRRKLIQYDEDSGWCFMETEYGPIISCISHCPYCGSKLR